MVSLQNDQSGATFSSFLPVNQTMLESNLENLDAFLTNSNRHIKCQTQKRKKIEEDDEEEEDEVMFDDDDEDN